jgi:hypothetical protein
MRKLALHRRSARAISTFRISQPGLDDLETNLTREGLGCGDRSLIGNHRRLRRERLRDAARILGREASTSTPPIRATSTSCSPARPTREVRSAATGQLRGDDATRTSCCTRSKVGLGDASTGLPRIRAYAQAMDLLVVVNTHDTNAP